MRIKICIYITRLHLHNDFFHVFITKFPKNSRILLLSNDYCLFGKESIFTFVYLYVEFAFDGKHSRQMRMFHCLPRSVVNSSQIDFHHFYFQVSVARESHETREICQHSQPPIWRRLKVCRKYFLQWKNKLNFKSKYSIWTVEKRNSGLYIIVLFTWLVLKRSTNSQISLNWDEDDK